MLPSSLSSSSPICAYIRNIWRSGILFLRLRMECSGLRSNVRRSVSAYDLAIERCHKVCKL